MSLNQIRFTSKKILFFLEGSEFHSSWSALLLDLNKDLFRDEALLKMKQMCSETWLGELEVKELPRGKWEWNKMLEGLERQIDTLITENKSID